VNVEKRRDPRNILISSNHDIQYDSSHKHTYSNIKKSFDEHDPNMSGLKKNAYKNLLLDPEEEDQIPGDNDYVHDFDAEDQVDQFFEMFMTVSPISKKTSIDMG